MKNSKFFRCLAFVGLATALLGTACSGPDKSVTFTVAFDTGGGSAVESQTVANADHATRPDDPVKDGFVFENWYMDSKCVTVFDFESVPITANWTLYANWTQRSTPYDDGGSSSESSSSGSEPAATTTTYTATSLPEWTKDAGAVMFVYAWTDGQDNGTWYTANFNTNLLTVEFTVPNEINRAIIVRCAAGTTEGSWDAKWNQTNDLTLDPANPTVETSQSWQ